MNIHFERGKSTKNSLGIGIESQFMEDAEITKIATDGWLDNPIIRKLTKLDMEKRLGIPVRIRKKKGKWYIQATIGGTKYEV